MSYQEQLSIPSSPTSETVKACSIGLHPPMRFYNDSFPIQSILWPQKSFCANVSGFCGLLKPQENVRTSEAVRRFPGQGYRSARLSPVPRTRLRPTVPSHRLCPGRAARVVGSPTKPTRPGEAAKARTAFLAVPCKLPPLSSHWKFIVGSFSVAVI